MPCPYPYSAQPQYRNCFPPFPKGQVCPTYPCRHTECRDKDWLEHLELTLKLPQLAELIERCYFQPDLYNRVNLIHIPNQVWKLVMFGVYRQAKIHAKWPEIVRQVQTHALWRQEALKLAAEQGRRHLQAKQPEFLGQGNLSPPPGTRVVRDNLGRYFLVPETWGQPPNNRGSGGQCKKEPQEVIIID